LGGIIRCAIFLEKALCEVKKDGLMVRKGEQESRKAKINKY